MEMQDIVAVGGTGAAVTWISKLLIQKFLDRNEKSLDAVKELQIKVAVLEERFKTVEKDINGVANLVRKNEACKESQR